MIRLLTSAQDLFDSFPDTLNTNVTGWLVYDDTAPKAAAVLLKEYAPFDDFTLKPQDGMEIYSDVDYSFDLDLKMVRNPQMLLTRRALTNFPFSP